MMGAFSSTQNGESNSPRARTFSTSSGSEVVSGAGLSFLHATQNAVIPSDRQRARSLSSVPDSHSRQEVIGIPNTNNIRTYNISESPETDSSSEDHVLDRPLTANINLDRVYTAHSLPSHISTINGIKCPICARFLLPDDIECHLVMCLTKPFLIYNEDVLSEDKGECVICFENLTQGDTIARLPCLCIYHKGCIDKWFNVNRSCPEHPGD